MGQYPRLARLFVDGRAKALIAAVAAFLSILALPDAYIDTQMFLYPSMRLLANSGLAPKVDSRLLVILYDDASRQALQREPAFADWLAVTETLAAVGIKKAFVLEPYTMDPGPTPVPPAGVELYLPVVVTNDKANTMSVDPEVYAEKTLPARPGAAENPATAVIGPKPAFLPAVAAIGHLNLFEDNSTFVSYETKTGRIPHIGMYATDAVERWEDTAHGGRVFVFLPRIAELVTHALPLRWFFGGAGYGDVKPLDDKRRQRLEGKEIAVFANAAFTGSRFVYSPQGLVLNALVSAGLINNVLTETLVVQPVSPLVAMGFALLLILGSLILKRHQLAGFVLTGVAVAAVLAGFFVLWAAHTFLPALSFGVPVLVAGLGRLYAWATESYVQKNQLLDQIGLGETIQALFMPDEKRGEAAGWRYEFTSDPHGPMSGDWIRIFKHQDAEGESLVVAFGDVVGKGPSAALITALIAGSLDRYERDGKRPDAVGIASMLNEDISSTFDTQQYTTLLLAVCRRDEVQLLRCGSYDWCVYDPAAKVAKRLTMPSNPPAGLTAGAVFRSFTLTGAAKDSLLFAFTDGVLDSNAGLKKALERLVEIPAPDDAAAFFGFVSAELVNAGKGHVLSDDRTIVGLTKLQ